MNRESFPTWIEPMLATLTQERFSDPGWVFERKLDGIRCLAYRNGGELHLYSRNQLEQSLLTLREALLQEKAQRFVVDGEVVAGAGFQSWQRRDEDPARIEYHVFDILHFDGQSTRQLPLLERRQVLTEELSFGGPLTLVTSVPEYGLELYQEACRSGWEGIIAKRKDSVYETKRSSAWLKMKCTLRQEFVIGGFTDPQGSRVGFGALLLGVYDVRGLRYAGMVGTGFKGEQLMEMRGEMDRMEVATSPFVVEKGLPRLRVHWVRPELVGEVTFTEWTRDGRLRHPSFLGLRADKDPHGVRRETSR